MTSDGELVRQTLEGGSAAYEQLVRRWSARVVAFCHARSGCAQAAEDLAQETLLRGFRSLATLSEREKFGPWLCGIAKRVCVDWLRKKGRRDVHFSALDDAAGQTLLASESDCAERDVDQADDVRRLMAEVEALPHQQREVILLYYYDDVTYKDLAETLGVSAATINARLTAARSALRSRLGCGRAS